LLVPVYLKYFGSDDYGAWILVNSFVQYLALANFGLPTTLTVFGANLKNKSLIYILYRKCLRLIFFIITAILLVGLALLYLKFLNPQFFFGTSTKSLYYFNSLLICFLLYLLRSPLQLSLSIFSAVGKGYLSKIYEIIANVCWPLAFLFVYSIGYGLLGYILLAGILMLIVSILSFVHSHIIVNKIYFIHQDIDIDEIPSNKIIVKSSSGFFLISIGASLVWNTDNIVIAKFLQIQDVTIYALTFRIYTLGFVIFSTINNILMPYYGIYKSQNNLVLLKKSYNNSVLLSSFLAIIIWISTFLFSKEIIIFWTKDPNLYGGRYLFFIMGFYGVILSYISSTAVLFSGIKIIRIPIFLTFIEGIVNLSMSVVLITKLKILGVAIGTLIGATINAILISYFFKMIVNNIIDSSFLTFIKNFLLGFIIILILLFFRFDAYNFIFKLYSIIFILLVYVFLFSKLNSIKPTELKSFFT
jgi:O-antigen/teichoic acid export membrane protein